MKTLNTKTARIILVFAIFLLANTLNADATCSDDYGNALSPDECKRMTRIRWQNSQSQYETQAYFAHVKRNTIRAWNKMQRIDIDMQGVTPLSEFYRRSAVRYSQINLEYVDSVLATHIRNTIQVFIEGYHLLNEFEQEVTQAYRQAEVFIDIGMLAGLTWRNRNSPEVNMLIGGLKGALIADEMLRQALVNIQRKYAWYSQDFDNRYNRNALKDRDVAQWLANKYQVVFVDTF